MQPARLHGINNRFADKICAYWTRRGCDTSDLKFWEVYIPTDDKNPYPIYCLRSNMINGFPPRLAIAPPGRLWQMIARGC